MKYIQYSLRPEIQKALADLNFVRPTDIQKKAIQPILDGEDVFAIAPTGTGKTAAFGIPCINNLIEMVKPKDGKQTSALILAPTRELVVQISKMLEGIAKYTSIKIGCIYGGVEQDSQIKELSSGINILVSTPGRMFDLIHQGYVNLEKIKIFIIDEADLMLDMGFKKDIQDVLKFLPPKRQNLFFSATINPKIKKLAYDIVRNAIRIQISPKNPVAKNITHAVAMVEMDDKRFFLENILKEYDSDKFVVFVRTKVRAERVVAAMERVGIHTVFLHGGIEQKERFKILENFRNNTERVLITTDVAARGIDIPNVEYVINYDLPDNAENYVHRVGRTGRGEKLGQALSFCSKDERPLLEAIEEYTGEKIYHYEINSNEYKQILLDTDDESNNWKKLMRENESENWEDK